MKLRSLVFSMLFLFLTTSILAQPTFQPNNDPAPPGKTWVKNNSFSDEFNGNSLNSLKWYDYHPYWVGRAPAMFKKDAVTVSNGSMQITNYQLPAPETVNGTTYTIAGGAVSSKANDGHYGYYECRMKASNVSMSSTFWLKNRWNRNNCPKSQTELDIIECIGGAKRHANFATKMHSNTHYIRSDCSGNQDWKSIGDGANVGGNVSAAYHVYGAYWKDANTILFYIDGVYKYTVNPSQYYDGTPFDRPMEMYMVTETYDWEYPPTPWELANLQTTTYYDWVRSWTLEDDASNTVGETVSLVNAPTTIAPQNSYTVNVSYTANTSRNIFVEFWSPSGFVASTAKTVNAGSGTTAVTINLNSPPAPGSGYIWKASIRPIGASWTQSIDTDQVNNVTVLQESIAFNNTPTNILSQNTYTINVDYVAAANRDLVVEFWSPSGFVTQSTKTVTVGSGTTAITVNLPSPPTPGNGYQWKASIRPVGSTWTQNIDNDQVNNVSIIQESIAFNNVPTTMLPQNAYTINVDYVAGTSRELVVAFWSSSGWIAQGIKTVNTGSGTTSITVNLPSAPSIGGGYIWKAGIRPIGTNSTQNIDTDQINNVAVVQNNETFAFNNAPTTIPAQTSYTLSVDYSANNIRDLVVEFWSPSGFIAATKRTVIAGSGTTSITVNLPIPPAPGSGYIWKGSIRPLGSNWTQSIDTDQVNNVTVAQQESIALNNAPTNIISQSSYTINVDYLAATNRDLVVEFWSPSGFIASAKKTVGAGSGTTPITVNLPSPPAAGTGYIWKASIRPVGASWTQNIDLDQVTNVTVTQVNETVAFNSAPTNIDPEISYTVTVDYLANTSRDLVVEFWSPSVWIAQGTTTVAAGSGTTSVTVDLPSLPAPGSGYLWKVSIRPVGTNWTQSIDTDQVPNVTVSNTETMVFLNVDDPICSQTNHTVAVSYVANTSRDVVAEFWNSSSWLSESAITVSAGTGTGTITVNLPNAPALGTGYIWKGSIRPVGTSWTQNIDTDQINNITVNYCPPKTASQSSATESISLYPNPATSFLTISYNSSSTKETNILIRDITGRTLFNQQCVSVEGKNQHTLDINDLPHGTYLLQVVQQDGTIMTKKVAK